MENHQKGWVKGWLCIAELLTDNYGGAEIYGDEIEKVTEFFQRKSDEIFLKTSDEDILVDAYVNDVVSERHLRFNSGTACYWYVSKFDYPVLATYESGLATVFVCEENKDDFDKYLLSLGKE